MLHILAALHPVSDSSEQVALPFGIHRVDCGQLSDIIKGFATQRDVVQQQLSALYNSV